MDPDEMMAGMSAQLYDEWQQFFRLEPWGEFRLEFMLAQLCSIQANSNRDSKKKPEPFKVQDFIPQRRKSEPKRKQTMDEQKAVVMEIARKLGAKPK